MNKIFKEYKEFTLRGNMVDLAVGIIIGGAFSKVVNSLVNDLVMPPLNLLMRSFKFTDMFIALDGKRYTTIAEAKEAGAITLNYGSFVTEAINLLIVAFVLFLIIRKINQFRKKKEGEKKPVIPNHKACPECLSDIPIKAKRCKFCTSVVES